LKKSYTHGDVIADPAYCSVRYEYTIESLANGNSPITQTVDKQVDIYYAADLTPLDETPLTVTVTAISESQYTTNESKQVTGTFNVHFDNPCTDTDFVTIQNAPFTNIAYTIDNSEKTVTHL